MFQKELCVYIIYVNQLSKLTSISGPAHFLILTISLWWCHQNKINFIWVTLQYSLVKVCTLGELSSQTNNNNNNKNKSN